jgi:hypothetical protein
VLNSVPTNLQKESLLRQAENSDLLIVGDSRTESGIVPKILQEKLALNRCQNIATSAASPINQIQVLADSGRIPKILIIGVSPASVYGGFYENESTVIKRYRKEYDKYKRIINIARYPYDSIENYLSKVVKGHFRFTYGSQGIIDVILFGKVSSYFDSDGWRCVNRLGSDLRFTTLVNLEAYGGHLLSRGVDKKEERDLIFGEVLMKFQNTLKILVRLPISESLRNIEDSYYPDFDQRIKNIAKRTNSHYIPSIEGYVFMDGMSDGSHLAGEDAFNYSSLLVEKLLKYLKKS